MQLYVNVHVCSLCRYPCQVGGLYNLYPWYSKTVFFSLFSYRDNSLFVQIAVAVANNYNLTFSFHQVPIATRFKHTCISSPKEKGLDAANMLHEVVAHYISFHDPAFSKKQIGFFENLCSSSFCSTVYLTPSDIFGSCLT